MASSKTRAPELKMIPQETFIEMKWYGVMTEMM